MTALPICERLRDLESYTLQEDAHEAADTIEGLYEALEWCVSHDGECLGDNVTKLLNARAALAKAQGDA